MLFSFIPDTLKRNSSISGKPVMTGRALAASVVEDHCPDLWTTTSISLLPLSSWRKCQLTENRHKCSNRTKKANTIPEVHGPIPGDLKRSKK